MADDEMEWEDSFFEISTFETSLCQEIYYKGPSGTGNDARMTPLSSEAEEYCRTLPIVNCAELIQHRFAVDVYKCIVEGRKRMEGFGYGMYVGQDEVERAVGIVTEREDYVNIELSKILDKSKI
jgi:hypothetical protein